MSQSPLVLHETAPVACNRAIILSGCARSGTTILGTVLHSMDGVEYGYEPPILYVLFALIDELAPPMWKLLYETSLYEDLLINAVAGRNLNCNRHDFSSIYRAKPSETILKRFERSLSRREAAPLAQQSRTLIKISDIVPYLPRVLEHYPGTQIVLIHRQANGTLHSLLERDWFHDDQVRRGDLIWPNRRVNGFFVPAWVNEADIPWWSAADALHRAAYYYVRMTRSFAKIPKAVIVSYEQLVEQPGLVIGRLAEVLGLTFGSKTGEVIASIRRRDRTPEDWVSRLQPEMRADVMECSDRYAARSVAR